MTIYIIVYKFIILIKVAFWTIFVVTQFFTPMHIGLIVKKIREEKGRMQKEVAKAVGMHPAN